MKLGASILSILLIISFVVLGFNYYNYDNYQKQIADKEKLKISLVNDNAKIDSDIANTNAEIDKLKKDNPDKVKLLETWQRKQKEVIELLS